MEPVVHSAGAWPRIRNLLIAAGDVLGVLVLIMVVTLIGSRDGVSESVAAILAHLR